MDLKAKINQLKQERQAVILSHYYVADEVQDIADYVGDSLELSRLAAKTDAKVIVFCGVHFMAESASILSPDKIVLLPDVSAGCPMADLISAPQLQAAKTENPQAQVVCYVNTSAEVKAKSDIVCTSANAVKVLQSLPEEKSVLFVPDRNLGAYAAQTSGRENVVLWQGCCYIHAGLTKEEVLSLKAQHPQAEILVHPECLPEISALADKVASTSGMLRYVGESSAREFIICTEEGLLHQLNQKYPDKTFYLASSKLSCPDMKKITLEKIAAALENLQPQVKVEAEVREKAWSALEKMLAL